MDNIERNNQVRYELYTRRIGGIIIQEPKGWENDTRSYERDKDSRGIQYKTNVDLEFYGNASEYLNTVFTAFGIQEKVILTKYEKDRFSINEKWKIRYVQELDMATFKIVNRTGNVTIKATEGGLYSDIKNRESDEYDLLNNESADGIDIGSIKTHPFEPKVRGIFLESLLRDSQTEYRINSERYQNSLSETSRTVPFQVVYNSDRDNVSSPGNSSDFYNSIIPHSQAYGINTVQAIGDQFYYRSDIKRSIRVKMTLEFKISKVVQKDAVDGFFRVEFRKSFQDGNNDRLKEREILLDMDGDGEIGILKTVSFDQQIDLDIGDSLSFVFAHSALLQSGTFESPGRYDVFVNVIKSELTVQDETDYAQTSSRVIKPFDLFERIVAKITGKKGIFKSSIFGVGGEYEHFVVDNGFWARGFPDTFTKEDGTEESIQLKTSFKDAFESFNYLEPLAWFVEIEKGKEVLRIEKATYTMQNFIGVRIKAADNIEREASKPDFFSTIDIGHDKSLEYEEINGLDEPNGKSQFTTHITRNESKYLAVSKFRFDSVGYELIRRKTYANFPKEDTPRDEDVWIHDAKVSEFGVYTHNLWPDHFDIAPTGIFDPDSAWNLRLSPMNRLFYGHGYSVLRGLYHYPDNKIRFNSSNANQNLTTKMNGLELQEKGSIFIKDFTKPRVEAEKITLTFRMTQEIENQLLGFTKVDGEFVPNYFGLVEYEETGKKKYGRLVKLDSDDQSTLTLINARL